MLKFNIFSNYTDTNSIINLKQINYKHHVIILIFYNSFSAHTH